MKKESKIASAIDFLKWLRTKGFQYKNGFWTNGKSEEQFKDDDLCEFFIKTQKNKLL